MSDDVETFEQQQPAWFTPGRLLALFCVMNLVVYVDRGAISSNGVNGQHGDATKGTVPSGFMGEFNLTLEQDNLLPAAFMVGLLVTAPMFANASKRFNAFRLIAVGLTAWTLAIFGCSVSTGFYSLLFCRMFVGIGEASFVSLASPFIDDNAPPRQKTAWLAAFYLCIPVGYAAGYIYGGMVGPPLGWRWAFAIEALAMLPFLLFCWLAPAIDLQGTHQGVKQHVTWKESVKEVAGDLRLLSRHHVYVASVLGFALNTGVLGSYAYLGPKAGRAVFSIGGEEADIVFGAMTMFTGVFGTLLGGVLLDWLGSSVRNALVICVACSVTGFACAFAAFAFARSLTVFVLVFGLAELALFAIQAPTNAVGLWSVPLGLRPFSMSTSTVMIHLLGDVPSPPILGWMQTQLQNWRLSMAITAFLLLVSGAFYLYGVRLCRGKPSYLELQSEHVMGPETGSDETAGTSPLLPHHRVS